MSVIAIPRALRERLGEEATEALVEIFNKVEPDTDKIKAEISKELSTKEDMLRLEARLELKIESVKSEIEKSKTDSIKWMLAFWASQIGIMIAAMAVLLKFFIK